MYIRQANKSFTRHSLFHVFAHLKLARMNILKKKLISREKNVCKKICHNYKFINFFGDDDQVTNLENNFLFN